jgi:hypothetical protein
VSLSFFFFLLLLFGDSLTKILSFLHLSKIQILSFSLRDLFLDLLLYFDSSNTYALMNNWNNTYERRAPSVPSQYGSSFAQNGYGPIACWECGMPGVVLAECKNEECIKKFQSKMSKRKAAAMTKGEQHFNIKTEDLPVSPSLVDGQMEVSGDDFSLNNYIGYDSTGCQFTQSGKKVGRKMILLGSQSTHSTFYVRELLEDIRMAPKPLKMLTNGGTIIYYQQGELPNYGTVWFNEEVRS